MMAHLSQGRLWKTTCPISFLVVITSLWGTTGEVTTTNHHPDIHRNGLRGGTTGEAEEPPTVVLHNGLAFPLRGLGVGNLPHELIPTMVQHGIRRGHVRLIDTAHASLNEALIDQAILAATTTSADSKTDSTTDTDTSTERNNIHVVSKVWYTHLGYERTKYSVNESIQAMPNVKHLHMLLHWPRCIKDIPWMDCTGEEEALPEAVKALGPPPHLDSDAYLQSWRALEDLYQQDGEHRLASIGISNFDLADLQTLLKHAKVVPHIIQLNVWSLLFHPDLIETCRHHNIHIQVYNVMNGIFARPDQSPHAMNHLSDLAESLDLDTPHQLVLSWLMQQGVSVIPRTSNMEHVIETAVATPHIDVTAQQHDEIHRAVVLLLQGQDLELPTATFVSQHHVPVHVFWKHDESGEEFSVKKDLQPGESFHSNTYPGHVFVVYEQDEASADNEQQQQSKQPKRREFQITAGYGDQEEIHIEL